MASLLPAGHLRRAALFSAAWLAAGLFVGPRAWAQSPAPAISGLVIQPLGSGLPVGPTITLDAPRRKGPEAVLYIDGKLSDNKMLVALNPDDISTINALAASAVTLVAPGASTVGALFITTRQHATDPAVTVFNRRVAELQQQSRPPSPPAPGGTPPAQSDQAVRLKSLDILPRPRLYVDGQLADSAAVAAVNPIDIASVYVLKGAAAAALSPQAAGRGVVSIITKRNARKHRVRNFEQRLRQLEAENPATPASIEQYNALQPTDVRYYLNGQLSTWAAVRAVYQTITGVHAQRGPQAAVYAHDPAITEVFLVETKP